MAGDNGTEFTTPVGRIVWGHPAKSQDKTDDNNVKILGANGQPIKQWSFGLAIPKADFQTAVWPYLAAETAKGYPNGVPPKFSYKYKDGDSTEPVWSNGKQGKPYAEREGHPGCYILTLSTEFQAPSLMVFENGAYRQIAPEQLKTGDFVMVGANTKWHAGQSPGLYVNPLTVLKVWEGDEISGSYTADPNALFGAQPQFGQMPAGARPIGQGQPQMPPQGAGMPGMGQQQPPMQQPPMQQMPPPGAGMPGMGQQPPMQQPPMQQPPMQQMPPPATDFIPGSQPPVQQGYPQPMTAAGTPQQGQMPPVGMPGMPGQMPPRQ